MKLAGMLLLCVGLQLWDEEGGGLEAILSYCGVKGKQDLHQKTHSFWGATCLLLLLHCSFMELSCRKCAEMKL